MILEPLSAAALFFGLVTALAHDGPPEVTSRTEPPAIRSAPPAHGKSPGWGMPHGMINEMLGSGGTAGTRQTVAGSRDLNARPRPRSIKHPTGEVESTKPADVGDSISAKEEEKFEDWAK